VKGLAFPQVSPVMGHGEGFDAALVQEKSIRALEKFGKGVGILGF
jgi:hypothetical protein